jgi:hypothetical protein
VISASAISELPTGPAVFALIGGTGAGRYVAFVGSAPNLRQRVRQHLVRRVSVVAGGKSAVSLNPDNVNKLRWWEHERFAERPALDAAELVAQETLNPALRNPLTLSDAARRVHYRPTFRRNMTALFKADPTGTLVLPNLEQAMERIAALEGRIEKLEQGG